MLDYSSMVNHDVACALCFVENEVGVFLLGSGTGVCGECLIKICFKKKSPLTIHGVILVANLKEEEEEER